MGDIPDPDTLTRTSKTYRKVYSSLLDSEDMRTFHQKVDAYRNGRKNKNGGGHSESRSHAMELAISDAIRDYLPGGQADHQSMRRLILSGDDTFRESVTRALSRSREDARNYVIEEVLYLDRPGKIVRLKEIARQNEDFFIRREAALELQRMAEADGNYALYYNPPLATNNRRPARSRWAWFRRRD